MRDAYRVSSFVSHHTLEQLTVLEDMPDLSQEHPQFHLFGQANGRLALGQQTAPIFDMIQQVTITGRNKTIEAVAFPGNHIPEPYAIQIGSFILICWTK